MRMRLLCWLAIGLVGCVDCGSSSTETPALESVGRARDAINGYTISLAAQRNPTLCGDLDPLIATVLQNGAPVTQPVGLYFSPTMGAPNTSVSDGIGVQNGQGSQTFVMFPGDHVWYASFVDHVIPLDYISAATLVSATTAPTTMAITTTPNPSVVGQDVTVQVTLATQAPSTPPVQIVLSGPQGNATLLLTVVNGTATATGSRVFQGLAAGDTPFTATFTDNSTPHCWDSASASVTQTVTDEQGDSGAPDGSADAETTDAADAADTDAADAADTGAVDAADTDAAVVDAAGDDSAASDAAVADAANADGGGDASSALDAGSVPDAGAEHDGGPITDGGSRTDGGVTDGGARDGSVADGGSGGHVGGGGSCAIGPPREPPALWWCTVLALTAVLRRRNRSRSLRNAGA